MDQKLLELAFLKLSSDVEQQNKKIEKLEFEIEELKKGNSIEFKPIEPDELLNTKDVLLKLGICYNSLAKLIKDGLIKPIRINQRRIRFSKLSILNYIKNNC